MTSPKGRAEIRKTFRNRYDAYAKPWTIPCAIDAWRSDNRGSSEPLFTRKMWEVVSGAVYAPPAEIVAYNESQAKARRTWIKWRVGGMLFASEISEAAFDLMARNRDYTTEQAVNLARQEVYKNHMVGEKKS